MPLKRLQKEHNPVWFVTEVCITWPTLNMLAEGYNILLSRMLAREHRPPHTKQDYREWFKLGRYE